MENGKWVDEQIAKLTPERAWQPDPHGALARVSRRRARRKNAFAGVVAVLACLSVLAAMELRGVSAADRTLKDRQRAPEFALKDAHGNVIRLSHFKNKVVLMNFWATWCHGCQTEIPWFMEFQDRYKDRGFTVIGVSMDDDGFKSVGPFCAMKKMNYPVVIGDPALAKLYGVESMPETLLIDRSGKIAALLVGVVEKDGLEREIRTLLN